MVPASFRYHEQAEARGGIARPVGCRSEVNSGMGHRGEDAGIGADENRFFSGWFLLTILKVSGKFALEDGVNSEDGHAAAVSIGSGIRKDLNGYCQPD